MNSKLLLTVYYCRSVHYFHCDVYCLCAEFHIRIKQICVDWHVNLINQECADASTQLVELVCIYFFRFPFSPLSPSFSRIELVTNQIWGRSNILHTKFQLQILIYWTFSIFFSIWWKTSKCEYLFWMAVGEQSLSRFQNWE